MGAARAWLTSMTAVWLPADCARAGKGRPSRLAPARRERRRIEGVSVMRGCLSRWPGGCNGGGVGSPGFHRVPPVGEPWGWFGAVRPRVFALLIHTSCWLPPACCNSTAEKHHSRSSHGSQQVCRGCAARGRAVWLLDRIVGAYLKPREFGQTRAGGGRAPSAVVGRFRPDCTAGAACGAHRRCLPWCPVVAAQTPARSISTARAARLSGWPTVTAISGAARSSAGRRGRRCRDAAGCCRRAVWTRGEAPTPDHAGIPLTRRGRRWLEAAELAASRLLRRRTGDRHGQPRATFIRCLRAALDGRSGGACHARSHPDRGGTLFALPAAWPLLGSAQVKVRGATSGEDRTASVAIKAGKVKFERPRVALIGPILPR